MGIIAKYKFNQNVYVDFTPEFNSEFTNYTIADETDTDGYTIRTISSDSLPTLMRFGTTGSASTNRENSLLEVLECNTDNITDMNSMFRHCSKLTSLNVSNFNTIQVTAMNSMFSGCTSLTSLDVSNFNTSQVTTMSGMFSGCNSLTSLDLSNFNTSKVTTMSYMFQYCSKLTSLNISNFDTSKVTDMYCMFQSCSKLTSLNISNFDTSKVTSMGSMFHTCSSLTSLNISNFDTSKVTDMSYMFYGCTSLKVLDLTSFNTKSATSSDGVFLNLTSDQIVYTNANLWTLDTSTYDATFVSLAGRLIASYKYNSNLYSDLIPEFTGLTSSQYTINDLDTNSTTEVDTSTWVLGGLNTETGAETASSSTYRSDYIEVLPSVGYIFSSNSTICYYNSSKTFISSETGMYDKIAPSNCKYIRVYANSRPTTFTLTTRNLKTRAIASDILPTMIRFGKSSIDDGNPTDATLSLLEVLEMNTSNITNMAFMFRLCQNLTTINTEINTSKVTQMQYVFSDCKSLTSLDLSNFNTSQVTTMSYMFSNCTSLTSLDLSNWDTSQVTNISSMFNNCTSLTSLDVPNFNTSKVTNMDTMFQSCSSLTSLDVSNFNTSKVTNMHRMFLGCTSLTSLDVSNFNTGEVTTMSNMFYNCTSLTSLDVSNFNTGEVTDMYTMFQNCKSLVSLDVSNWNTSNVTNMGGMFSNCTSLTSLDVSNFNTSNVTTMSYMFTNCSSLTSLDVSNFNTGEVTDMSNMFRYCSSLTSLDVSNFDTSKVSSIDRMFVDCSKLIDIGMIYCNSSTINKISDLITTDTTIYYHDANLSDLTVQDNITYQYYDKSTITLPYELNKLPNGVADYIDVVNGVYVQRVGKQVFNGSENWVLSAHENSTQFYTPLNNLARKKDYLNSMSCDKFVVCAEEDALHDSTLPNGISAYADRIDEYPNENWLYIKLANSEGSAEKLKTYLASNPTTVIYELAKPVYTPLTDEEKALLPLSAYSSGYIQLSSDELRPSKFEFRAKSSNRLQLDMLEIGHYYLNAPTGNVKLGNVDIDVTEMPCLIKVDNASNNRLVVNVADFFYKEIPLNYEEGFLDIGNGTVSTEYVNGRWVSDFVEIPYYDKYIYIMNDTELVDICYYDENKNFVTGVAIGNVKSGQAHWLTGNTVAKYMRFSGKNSERVLSLRSHVITLSKLPSHRIPTTFTQGMKSSVDFGYWQGIKYAKPLTIYTTDIVEWKVIDDTHINGGNGIELHSITGKYSGISVTVEDEIDISTGKYTKRVGKYVIDGTVAPYSSLAHEEKYNIQKVTFVSSKTGIKPKYRWDDGSYGLAITDLLKFSVSYNLDEPHIFIGSNALTLYFKAGIFGAFTMENVQNYFKENPMTVYYELETPEITYLDLERNEFRTASNSTSMQIQTSDNNIYLRPQVKPSPLSYPTTLSPNTQYTVFHNRKNYNGSVKTPMINLGGTEVAATGSRTVVTTPSTLAHNELQFIGGENTVEQVMVLHGDWTKEGKTVDYFEGLQSSVIGDKTLENLVDEPTEIWSNKVTSNGSAVDYVSIDDIIAVGYGNKPKLPEVQVGTNICSHGMTLQNLAVEHECIAEPNAYIRTAVYDGVLPIGTYIFFYNVIEPNTTTQSEGNERFTPYYTCQDGSTYYEGWGTLNQTTGLKYWKFTATSPITTFGFWIANIDTSCSANNFMLLQYQQGMENWDIPYFEGMQSVKMPVLKATGKNLIDINTLPIMDGQNCEVIDGIVYKKPTTEHEATRWVIPVKPNTTYTISAKGSTGIVQISNFLQSTSPNFDSRFFLSRGDSSVTFTTSSHTELTLSIFNSEVANFEVSDIQLEYGTQATSYEPYKSNILTVNEEVELRGVGSYKDVIGWNDGIIRRNCVEFTITGEEGYNYYSIQENTNTVVAALEFKKLGLGNKVPGYRYILCDKIPYGEGSKDVVHFRQDGNEPSKSLMFWLDKTKFSTYTSQGVNDYIKSIGGLTIVAPLINTSYEDVEIIGGGNWKEFVLTGSNSWWDAAGEGDTTNGFSIWTTIDDFVDANDENPLKYRMVKESELEYIDYFKTQNSTNFITFNPIKQIIINVKGCHSVEQVKTWLDEHPITILFQSTGNRLQDTTPNTDVLIFNHGTLYTTTDTHPSTFSDFSLKTTNRYIVKDFDKLKYTVLTEQPFNFNGIDYPTSSTGMTIVDVTGISDSSIYSDDPMITVVQDDGSYYADGVLTQFKGEKTFIKEFVRTSNDTYNTGMTLLEPLELNGLPNGVRDSYNPTTGEIVRNIGVIDVIPENLQGFENNGVTSKAYLYDVRLKDRDTTQIAALGVLSNNFSPIDNASVYTYGIVGATNNFPVWFSLENTITTIEDFQLWFREHPQILLYKLATPKIIKATPTSTYISTRPENGNIIAQDIQMQVEYLNYDNEQSIISPRMLGDGDEIRWEQGSQCYVYENDNEYIPLTDHDELFGANIQAQEYTQYAESVDGADIEVGVALKEKAVYEQTYVKYEDNVVYPETMENIDETNGVEVDYICGATWQNPNDLSDIRHLGELREDGQYNVIIRRSGDDEIRLLEGTTHIGLDYDELPSSEFELTFFNSGGVEVGKYGDTTHILEDCVENSKLASGTVYGQTLVNLVTLDTTKEYVLEQDGSFTKQVTFKLIDGFEDDIYTIMFEMSNVNIVNPNANWVVYISTASEIDSGADNMTIKSFIKNGRVSFTYRPNREQKTQNWFNICLHTDSGVGSTITIKNVMVFKGDHTQKDIPYFEGIGSTVVNGFSSCGKNLLNPNWQLNTWYPFKLKSGTKLTLSTKDSVLSKGGNIRLMTTDETDIWIGIDEGATQKTITLQKDVYKLSNMLNGDIEYQLEIGDNTPYEPYKSTNYTLPTPITLRSVGDVCDTFDVVSGVETCNTKKVMASSLTWDDSFFSDPNCTCYRYRAEVNNVKSNSPILTLQYNHYGDDMNTEGIREIVNSIYFQISKDKITTNLKDWLKDNDFEITYQLKTPQTIQHTLIPSTTQTMLEPTFILPQPLRSVPNGICDRLYWDENKGHYCIEKRIGKLVLDNTIPTINHGGFSNTNYVEIYMPFTTGALIENVGYCEDSSFTMNPYNGVNFKNSVNYKAFAISTSKANLLVPRNEISEVIGETYTNDSNLLRTYLSLKPVTLLIPLATSEIIDLPYLDKKVELPTQPNIYPIGYKAIHEKANPEIGLTIPYKVLNMPTQPVNLNFVMDIADYVLTWDDVKEARQYNIILNDEVIATVKEPQYNTGEEMYGYILVEANNEIGDNLSEELYIKTVPNAPAQLTVAHNPLTDHYDFEISFIDTSDIADYYTVMYKVDGGEWVINTIQNSELTTGEKHLWSFSVYEIKESIEVWATATNDVGTNDILPTAIYYMSPTPQWTYRINSKDVFLRWLDESPYDTKYKLRYSYKSNGQFQYAYFEGDATEIGKLYEAVLPLAEDDEVTLALCIVSEKENLYCKPVKASKPLDPNIVPPMNFNYHWLARGLIEFYWQDQYDVDVEYEYILESMKANETLWTQVNEIIPSEDVDGTGTIYRVEYQLEDLEQIRMKVRMKWAMNETEWTETLTTVFIPVEGNPPTYIRRTQTAEGLLVEWEAQAYIDSYHIYVIDNETGEELQHLETSDNSILVNLDYSNSIEIAIYEISRFSGGIESDPTDPMVFTPTMFATDIDQRIYRPCAEEYPIEVSTVQKATKQPYVIHDISYTPNVETEHEVGVAISSPFQISYHPMMVDVHQAGSRDEHTINAHIKTLDVRNEDLIRVMTFERTQETYDMNFTVYTPSVASYPINLEVSKVRIVCLGDSLTSGHPFYWAETGTGMIEASYPYQLSRRLKNQYEVINSGYG